MSGFLFISCVRFSLQLLLAESAFLIIFPRRERFWLRALSGGIGYLAVLKGVHLAVTSVPGSVLWVRILYYLTVFLMMQIYVLWCFEISWEELVFAGTGGYAAQHMAYSVSTILQYVLGYTDSNYWLWLWVHVLPFVLAALFVWFCFVRPNREKGELVKNDVRMIWLSLLLLFVTIIVSLMARSDGSELNNFLQRFICNIYGASCCLLILLLLFHIPRENKLSHEKETMEQIIQVMGERQQLSRENIEIINRKCHDIKHQLKALEDLEDKKQRSDYVKEIRDAISIYDAIYQTGNSALDSVLRDKGFLCQEYNIKFSCMVDGERLSFMDTLDIYALFGNALDNAIESVMREADEEKRLINMHVARNGGMLHIHIDNYCRESVTFEDGLPLTTKEDKNYHGIGVRSIRHIAEKYNGNVVMRYKKERFLLDLLLPIPLEKEGGSARYAGEA